MRGREAAVPGEVGECNGLRKGKVLIEVFEGVGVVGADGEGKLLGRSILGGIRVGDDGADAEEEGEERESKCKVAQHCRVSGLCVPIFSLVSPPVWLLFPAQTVL